MSLPFQELHKEEYGRVFVLEGPIIAQGLVHSLILCEGVSKRALVIYFKQCRELVILLNDKRAKDMIKCDENPEYYCPHCGAPISSLKEKSSDVYECDDLHIVQNMTGLYSFIGNVPAALGELRLATKEDIKEGEAAQDNKGDMRALKFPSFKTPYDAFTYAKSRGFISTSYLQVSKADKFYVSAVICRDTMTGKLFNPLDKGEGDRPGHVTRLTEKEVEDYTNLGMSALVFWSLYETGLDSLSSLVDDFKTESEAIEAREEKYRKAVN